jgi:alpha-tubulin suppressor-like RCC1 family protein
LVIHFITFNKQDDSKKLYVLGSSKNGKSGLGISRGNIEIPQEIETLSNIEQISCGRDFCLSLDSSNQVNSWGVNNFGQLGGYDHYSSDLPHLVRYLSDKNIIKVRFVIFRWQQEKTFLWHYLKREKFIHGE